MWPILTKVRYEALGRILLSKKLWVHMGISFVLNWIVGPLVMLGLAWATLPDLPTYRTGVIMVGIARCIAMVMVWNQLAGGDGEYCALLVVANSVLQIILYSPYAVLFIDVIGSSQSLHLQYGAVAVSVLIVRRCRCSRWVYNDRPAVLGDPPGGRGDYPVHCHASYVETVPSRRISSKIFPTRITRSFIHHHRHVRLPGTPYRT